MKTLKIMQTGWEVEQITEPGVFRGQRYSGAIELKNGVDIWFSRSHQIKTVEEAQTVADLICEAGTVANETGLTPRQLLERYNEVMEVLREADTYFTKLTRGGKLAKRVSNQIDQVIEKYTT